MQVKPLLQLGYRFGIAAFALVMLAPTLPVRAKEAQPPAGTLARVRQTGTLRLGYYSNAGPFSYQDEAGNPAGYTVALCQEIAQNLKTELALPTLAVEFVSVGADRFDAVEQGRVDLLCGPSVETLARRKTVSYSIPVSRAVSERSFARTLRRRSATS